MYTLHNTDGHLSEQYLVGADPIDIPTAASAHSSAKPSLLPSSSDATRVVAYEPSALQALDAEWVPHGRSSELVLVRRNLLERSIYPGSNPYIPTTSSFPSPTIPPEPHIPLSFLGEEKLRVQTSTIDATDLDMRSCVLE